MSISHNSSAEFHENQLIVNGKPLYLRGAEIHYFRLPRDTWHHRLEAAKSGGMNTVSSYMPWYWHEPEEGHIDLEGHSLPERDLRGFLELAAEMDLNVIARPGPFVNSELRFGGFPEWLFRDHPENMSRRGEGGFATGRPCPAEGEQVYRQYVRKWYSRVVPVIADFDIHNGGSVILFQPDNELSAAWSFGLLNSLFDPETITVHWPGWLQRTYSEISLLNERYGTSYTDFKEVEVPRCFPDNITRKACAIDWMNFKRWFFADWGATMAEWAQEFGIKVPILLNEPVAGFYGHGDHSGTGVLLKQRGIRAITACHTYADRIMDLEGIQGAAIGIEIVKSSPLEGPPLTVEMNCGWYMPRMSRSEINWEILLRLGLGHGLMGSVVYPFVANMVSYKDVIDAPEYWGDSCINPYGDQMGPYSFLKQFNGFIRSWNDDLTDSKMVADLTLAYSPGQRLLDFLGAPSLGDNSQTDAVQGAPGGESFDTEPVLDKSEGSSGHEWLDGAEGVSRQTVPPEAGVWKKTKEAAMLCSRMNISYNMLDMTNPEQDFGQEWLLVPCVGALEKKSIDFLVSYLDSGGGCLFFPTIPTRDLLGVEDLRIAERLNVYLSDTIRPAGGRVMDYGCRVVDYGDGKKFGTHNWIFLHQFPNDSHILATYDNKAVCTRLSGDNDNVIIAGFDMCFTTLSSINFWMMIVRDAMGIEPVIETSGNFYHALLRRGSDNDFLTVMNVIGVRGKGELSLQHPVVSDKKLTLELSLEPQEARCLVINKRFDDIRMIYSTSEVILDEPDYKNLTLYGHPGTPGEIMFDRPVDVKLAGNNVEAVRTDNGYLVQYQHQIEPLKLTFQTFATGSNILK